MNTTFISLPLELSCFLKRFKSGPYLAWQLTSQSKEELINHAPDQLKPLIKKFLLSNGHITIVGNFGYQNRKAFNNKGAVEGVLKTFPKMQNMIDQKTEFTIKISGLLGATKNPESQEYQLICAVVEPTKCQSGMIFREDLPQDKGISSDFFDGHSHITCYIDQKKGWKAKDSNLVINQYFQDQVNPDQKSESNKQSENTE